ncbi:3-hydroxyacyl-ACP dehydratase FabZ family protein [Fimbriiglobus ruber]|nr:3-hydroxyacyl-ACP dehydratase FabZ family protein [Fimbriiglobus ruber]
MPLPEPHYDLDRIDYTRVIADRDAIRGYLPHRYELEMLTAVVYVDPERQIVVGYKDVTPDEFWVRGHFPERPLLPGVLMCEAAAQLAAFYAAWQKINDGKLMGLGGIENTRFRRSVVPGERLTLVGKGSRVRPRLTMFNVQGYVGTDLAFHTDVMGVVLERAEEA